MNAQSHRDPLALFLRGKTKSMLEDCLEIAIHCERYTCHTALSLLGHWSWHFVSKRSSPMGWCDAWTCDTNHSEAGRAVPCSCTSCAGHAQRSTQHRWRRANRNLPTYRRKMTISACLSSMLLIHGSHRWWNNCFLLSRIPATKGCRWFQLIWQLGPWDVFQSPHLVDKMARPPMNRAKPSIRIESKSKLYREDQFICWSCAISTMKDAENKQTNKNK